MKNKTLLRRNKINDNFDGWVFLLPMVVIVYLFIWRPTFIGGVLSFFDMKGYNVDRFCGFDNYRKVLMNSAFLPTFWNTIEYVFWSLIIGFSPPLFIATILNEVIHFKNGFRSLIYIPAVIPGIAAMLMWYFIYYPDETGLLNMILTKFNIGHTRG